MRTRSLAAFALTLGLLAPAPTSLAHQQEKARPNVDDVVEDVAPEDAVMANQRAVAFSEDNFDQWVFGGGRNGQAARKRLETLLVLRISDIERDCRLSDVQKKKLELAGKGDIKKFFDKVDESRRHFKKIQNDQNKIGELFQEIQPLQATLNSGSGPFNDGSVFVKTLRNTLDETQYAAYKRRIDEAKSNRYRAKVDLVVGMLDNAVGMNDDQRKRLVKLLLEETKPPKKFGQYDYYVVMLQAARLPEAKVRPIFDDAQWKVVTQQFNQAKGVEATLKGGDFLPEGMDDSDKAKPGDPIPAPAARPRPPVIQGGFGFEG